VSQKYIVGTDCKRAQIGDCTSDVVLVQCRAGKRQQRKKEMVRGKTTLAACSRVLKKTTRCLIRKGQREQTRKARPGRLLYTQ